MERAERRDFPARIVSTTDEKKGRQTRVILDLAYRNLPTAGLTLEVEYDGNYDRSVQFDVADSLDEPITWRPAFAGQIYRIDRLGFSRAQNALEYPETRGRYGRLTIFHGDGPPVVLRSASAGSRRRFLLCERAASEGEEVVALYAGNPKLPPPNHDLSRTMESRSLDSALRLELQWGEANPFYVGPVEPERPWSERNGRLVWSATVVGVLIFAGLTVMLLRRAGRDTTTVQT